MGLKIQRLPIADLSEDPANLRVHGEPSIAILKASLRRFGQQKPIVVDENQVVVAGNGTLRAARELGLTHLDCVKTGLAGVERVAYAIADNRTAQHSTWDEAGLALTLRAIQSEELGLDGLGFDDSDVDRLAGSLARHEPFPAARPEPGSDDVASGDPRTPPEPPEEFRAYDEAIPTEYCCPKCGYRWSGKPS